MVIKVKIKTTITLIALSNIIPFFFKKQEIHTPDTTGQHEKNEYTFNQKSFPFNTVEMNSLRLHEIAFRHNFSREAVLELRELISYIENKNSKYWLWN